jgi:hypothetical protein
MLATITRFENVKANQGKRFRLEWALLFDRLCHPAEARDKFELPLWAPTLWPRDSKVEGNEPIELCALVLDLDHGATLSAGIGAIQDGPMACLHTSWQHQREVKIKDKATKEERIVKEDRFRMVFPLRTAVASARYALVWRSAERWMREKHGLTIDPQAKNPGRCWFIPAHARGFLFEAHRNDGPLLDPWELVERWPTLRAAPPPRPQLSREREGDRSSKLKRASAYLAKLPESVAGQGGHSALWTAALSLVKGFALDPHDAQDLLMREFNPRCQPEWSERAIVHKVKQAMQSDARSGFIPDRDRKPSR